MKNLPVILVLVTFTGVTIVSILDAAYRKDFMQLANTMVVGFWAWMQAPKRES